MIYVYIYNKIELFTHETDTGECTTYFNVIVYFTMALPYFSRLLQCLRRYHDSQYIYYI